jgi:hypothetical protein
MFGEAMTRTFIAQAVDVSEMMDGDIVQVLFALRPEEARLYDGEDPYISISVNYEFDGRPQVEWHEGCGGRGGLAVESLVLHRDRVIVEAGRGTRLDIGFSLSDEQFEATAVILTRMLGGRIERIATEPEPSAPSNRREHPRSRPGRAAGGG